MKLPDAARAEVPRAKLRGYLLSETHPEGRFKARFFRSVGLGDAANLVASLLNVAQYGEVTAQVSTEHGRLYVVEGEVQTPTGTLVALRTVWILEHGGEAPRLVTAYPR